MHRRRAALAAALALVPALLGSTARISLAQLNDTAASTQTIGTGTLAPPTSLAATGGTSASLTWTATTSTTATGYDVQRATVSGGPYAVVSSVTPRTTVSTTDTPAASGTYYYVLRTTLQGWQSVNSNQASAVVVLAPTVTGYKVCTSTSNAADTGGDGNGYESTPANGCTTDAAVATDTSSGTNVTTTCTDAGKDRHRYWDFTLGLPGSLVSIGGLQLRADSGLNATTGTNLLCAQLSWDAGTTWTATKSIATTTTAIATYTLGATNDTWGHSWTSAQLSNANFRVRLIDVSSVATRIFKLDGLAVQVTYTP
jgi:hypothetical protein